MTDRYDSFVVVLERDIREDDAKETINAIKQIKGVLNVVPHINDISTHIAELRVRSEFLGKILEVLK